MISPNPTRLRFARLLPAAALPLLAACITPAANYAAAAPQPVTVGIVAINDFHGALEPPKTSVLVPNNKADVLQLPAGGAAYLASAVDSIRSRYPNHLTVAAGDLIGATQLSSSLFLDEPTIGVMNRIGLDFNAVGNHEFDRGRDELKRKQDGGCRQLTPLKPCRIEQFAGAKFKFLAANSIEPNGKTLFPASAIRSFGTGKGQVKIGIIGITLKETADLSSREGLQGVTFADEADTVNALVPQLKEQGADGIVLLIHQGGYTKGERPDPQGCPNLTGGIRAVLDRLDTRIDVVVSGHTHWSYVCDYAQFNPAKPFLLTSAGVFGQVVTDITLAIDPVAGRVVAKRARNLVVQSEGYANRNGRIEPNALFPIFAARSDVAAYVQLYSDAAKIEIQRPAGKLAGEVSRPGGDFANTGGTLGSLIADAQLGATRKSGAQIAFMNPFGIRAPHTLVPGPDGMLTFGQLYAVQPFDNALITQSLTGAELKAVLENGFDDLQPKQVLSASSGFVFSYDLSRPAGDRVVAMTLNGQPIDPAATYRVTTNSFLANGGDSFSALARLRDAVVAPMNDIAALESWLGGDVPRAVPSDVRAIEIKH
ncbi:MAG: bifunctional metallophosphatase/5'-nucleotidase [Novosphingobium sp.]|uniref:bifunctional metallophosphatase/5'-nucleotidase n=1 Tax=Novosphingobium sp. TaxID=1874826 RepID=UPI0032BB6281